MSVESSWGRGMQQALNLEWKEFSLEEEVWALRIPEESKQRVYKQCQGALQRFTELRERIVQAAGGVSREKLEQQEEDYLVILEEEYRSLQQKQRTLGARALVERLRESERREAKRVFERLREKKKTEEQEEARARRTNLQLKRAFDAVEAGEWERVRLEEVYAAAEAEIAENEKYSREEREGYAREQIYSLVQWLFGRLIEKREWSEAERRLTEYKVMLGSNIIMELREKLKAGRKVEECVKKIRGAKKTEAEKLYLELPVELQQRVRNELRRVEGLEIERVQLMLGEEKNG